MKKSGQDLWSTMAPTATSGCLQELWFQSETEAGDGRGPLSQCPQVTVAWEILMEKASALSNMKGFITTISRQKGFLGSCHHF